MEKEGGSHPVLMWESGYTAVNWKGVPENEELLSHGMGRFHILSVQKSWSTHSVWRGLSQNAQECV